jgi:hypothetical protein
MHRQAAAQIAKDVGVVFMEGQARKTSTNYYFFLQDTRSVPSI